MDVVGSVLISRLTKDGRKALGVLPADAKKVQFSGLGYIYCYSNRKLLFTGGSLTTRKGTSRSLHHFDMFVFPANNDGYRKRKKAYRACVECKKGRVSFVQGINGMSLIL